MMLQRLLLPIALGLIFLGFVLLVLGSIPSTSAGGCFFWPFPVIFVCGAGTGCAIYIALVVGAAGVVAVLISSLFLRMRRAPEDSSRS